MLRLIRQSLGDYDRGLRAVFVRVDRLTLAKRIWRGAADDGTEFGFELTTPARHGETIFASTDRRYEICQQPEALLEISLEIAPSTAAGIGWAIGNLHLELSAEPTRLLALDEPAVRQLLTRLQVPFVGTSGIFRPGRFARGTLPVQELGGSHRHSA
jgi:urease accessory protein